MLSDRLLVYSKRAREERVWIAGAGSQKQTPMPALEPWGLGLHYGGYNPRRATGNPWGTPETSQAPQIADEFQVHPGTHHPKPDLPSPHPPSSGAQAPTGISYSQDLLVKPWSGFSCTTVTSFPQISPFTTFPSALDFQFHSMWSGEHA